MLLWWTCVDFSLVNQLSVTRLEGGAKLSAPPTVRCCLCHLIGWKDVPRFVAVWAYFLENGVSNEVIGEATAESKFAGRGGLTVDYPPTPPI